MKKKNDQSHLYVVVRKDFVKGLVVNTSICAGTCNLEKADELRGVFEQEWVDRTGDHDNTDFEVLLTTYHE